MTKVISIVMVLMLLTLLSASAEDVLFPNGATVGMTVEQVTALEGREPDRQSGIDYPDGSGIVYYGQQLGQYTTGMLYYFIGNQLTYVGYSAVSDADAFDSLTKMLTAAYGEGSVMTMDEQNDWNHVLYESDENVTKYSFLRMSKWQVNASTMVCLYELDYTPNPDSDTLRLTTIQYRPIRYAEIIPALREAASDAQ